MPDTLTTLLLAYGHVKSARAALDAIPPCHMPRDFEARYGALIEELRVLARDIAKEAGL